MREVRFHRELYRGEAVDQSVKILAPYATFALVEEPTHWLVRIEATTPARERKVLLELQNHALGLTIRTRA